MSDEDSEPGVKGNTSEQVAVIRERLKATDKRVGELWGDVDEMAEDISAFKRVQAEQNTVQAVQATTLETLIEFHKEIKKYATWAIMGRVRPSRASGAEPRTPKAAHESDGHRRAKAVTGTPRASDSTCASQLTT